MKLTAHHDTTIVSEKKVNSRVCLDDDTNTRGPVPASLNSSGGRSEESRVCCFRMGEKKLERTRSSMCCAQSRRAILKPAVRCAVFFVETTSLHNMELRLSLCTCASTFYYSIFPFTHCSAVKSCLRRSYVSTVLKNV